MTGAITDIQSLERWFKTNDRPFWSVSYAGPNPRVIARNDKTTDVNQAWDNLEAIIKMQTEAGRAVLEVLQYGSDKGAQGHALRTNVDIRDPFGGYASNRMPAPAQGIAGYGVQSIGDIKEMIDTEVALALLERENEELKAAINAPSNMLERVIEKVAESPHLSAAVAQLIAGLFNRGGTPVAVNGVTPPPPPPAAPPVHHVDTDDDDLTEEDRLFWDNINSAAQTLGVDVLTLAVKLNNLVQQNPAMAKSLIA